MRNRFKKAAERRKAWSVNAVKAKARNRIAKANTDPDENGENRETGAVGAPLERTK